MLATVQKQKKKKKKNNPEGLKVFVCKYNKERKTTTTPKTATKKKKTKKTNTKRLHSAEVTCVRIKKE